MGVAKIARKGDERAFRSVFFYLKDKDSHMQTHVCQALGKLANTLEQRRSAAAAINHEFMRAVGPNPTRRRAAEVALEMIAEQYGSDPRAKSPSVRASQWLQGLSSRLSRRWSAKK